MSITPGYASVSIGRQDDDGGGGEEDTGPKPAPPPSVAETPISDTPITESHYFPIYVITAVFGAIFIFGPLIVRKGPNKSIVRVCIMLTAFCCWILWVTCYIATINPLLGPRLHNTTVAWMGHHWGRNPKDLGGSLPDTEK